MTKEQIILKNAFKNPGLVTIIISPNKRVANSLFIKVSKLLKQVTFDFKTYNHALNSIITVNMHRIFFITLKGEQYFGCRSDFVYVNNIDNPKIINELAIPLLTINKNPVQLEQINLLEDKLIKLGIFLENDRTKISSKELIDLKNYD